MNKRQRLKHKNHRIALWHAVTHGDMRRTRKLLRLVKADREILHGAIFSGQSRGLVELVQQSVGLSAEDVKISMFFYAVQDDDVPAVEAFIRLGMSPDTILDEYGSRPLHCAYSGKMAQALIAAGADVNALNRFGEPPVFSARREVLKVLLAAGANARTIGKFGQTALLHHHSAEDIRLLLAAGADPHRLGPGEDTPLHIAEDAESVRIYVELGLKVNARNILGDSPLFLPYNLEVAQALLAAGADPCTVDDEGKTPLHCCSKADIATCLIAAGAHVNAEDENGRTPLDYALDDKKGYHGQKSLIAALLRAGAARGSGKPHA